MTYFKCEVTLGMTIQRHSNTEHYLCPQFLLYLQTEVPSFISQMTYFLVPAHRPGDGCPGGSGGTGETRPATLVREGKLGRQNWQAGQDEAPGMGWGNGFRTDGVPFMWHFGDIRPGSSS